MSNPSINEPSNFLEFCGVIKNKQQKALVGMGYHFVRELNDEFEKGWKVVAGTFINAG